MARFPDPKHSYDQQNEAQFRGALQRELALTHRKRQDLELVQEKLILHSPGGLRWVISVDDAGALSVAPA